MTPDLRALDVAQLAALVRERPDLAEEVRVELQQRPTGVLPPCALPDPCACIACRRFAAFDLCNGARWFMRLPSVDARREVARGLPPAVQDALREALGERADGDGADGKKLTRNVG